MWKCARMFGVDCRFRSWGAHTDVRPHVSREDTALPSEYPTISLGEIEGSFGARIAFDNLDDASPVYGFRPPANVPTAVMLGNERRGLSPAVKSIRTHSVEIPLVSRQLNCLNVAAASAVALYYLTRGGGAKLHCGVHPEKRRPEVLLMGAANHVELGSAIRSAGAFGWNRLLVDDRAGVWFGCSRAVQSEGRAAARRYRNPIHLFPAPLGKRPFFEDVVVVLTQSGAIPLHRVEFAGGARQLLVIPDPCAVDVEAEDWASLGRHVRTVSLELPHPELIMNYRLVATIVLAEAARQVGQRNRQAPRLKRGPAYDYDIRIVSEDAGEIVFPDELVDY